MRHGTLPPNDPADLAPPYLPPADLDYAAAFRSLASLHCEITREGLSKERVLRRAQLLFTLGNPFAAALDAERAVRMDPHWTEAQYLRGQAFLTLAGLKHGVVQPGVGAYLPIQALPPRRHLLLTARQCFRQVLAANPQDEQAAKGLAATERLLASLQQQTQAATDAAIAS